MREPQGAVALRIAAVGEDRVLTSIVVACELRYGAAKRGARRLTRQVEAILAAITISPFEIGADRHYATIRAAVEKKGTPSARTTGGMPPAFPSGTAPGAGKEGVLNMAQHSRIFDRRSRQGARLALTATQILITIAVCVIEVIAQSATSQPDSLLTSVTAVTDGDTIRIGRRRVSLLGITAPRLGVYDADPLARAARDRLASLVLLRFVRLEYDGPRGRAYVSTEDGVFVNAEIVRAGLARVTGPPTLKRIEALRAAEADARAARRGIWR